VQKRTSQRQRLQSKTSRVIFSAMQVQQQLGTSGEALHVLCSDD
jgi:hypothetical protein